MHQVEHFGGNFYDLLAHLHFPKTFRVCNQQQLLFDRAALPPELVGVRQCTETNYNLSLIPD